MHIPRAHSQTFVTTHLVDMGPNVANKKVDAVPLKGATKTTSFQALGLRLHFLFKTKKHFVPAISSAYSSNPRHQKAY